MKFAIFPHMADKIRDTFVPNSRFEIGDLWNPIDKIRYFSVLYQRNLRFIWPWSTKIMICERWALINETRDFYLTVTKFGLTDETHDCSTEDRKILDFSTHHRQNSRFFGEDLQILRFFRDWLTNTFDFFVCDRWNLQFSVPD